MKKLLSVMLTVIMLLPVFATVVAADGNDEYELVEVTGGITEYVSFKWVKSGGKWYCRTSAGSNITGLAKLDGTVYFFDSKGVMKTGWQEIAKSWYYFASSGAMKTGWQKISRKWYYFTVGGVMVTGVRKIGSDYYVFKTGGEMATGWAQVGSYWYYLSKSGAAYVSKWLKSGKTWYYFGSSGVMATGSVKIDGKYYYFASGGAMQTGWVKAGKEWYYMDKSGAAATGWKTLSGTQYYFNNKGMMLHDTVIDGITLGPDGKIVKNTEPVGPSDDNKPSQATINYDAGEYSISKTHSGEGTYYDRTSTGAANLDDYESVYYTAAMNTYDYMNNMAGAYIEVTDKDGDKINVLITDRLPEGKKGDIDLTRKSFGQIEKLVTGRMNITWKIVPLPTNDPVAFKWKPTSSQYWAEVQVRNHRYPVKSLEYLNSNGKYVALTRQEYNYFTAPNGMGKGPFTFRITDIYGHQIIESGIAMNTTGKVVNGSKNFPY